MRKKVSIFRYVPYPKIGAYLDLGWYWDGTLMEGPHIKWAVVMEWLCDCPVREPKREIPMADVGVLPAPQGGAGAV